MEVANKEAAEECLSKAQASFRKGSFREALRLAEKSSRMCRTEEADEFINEINAVLESTGSGASEAPSSEAANGPEASQRRGATERTAEAAGSHKNATAYTQKQKEAVDRVLKAENFYTILGVTKDVSEDDLKKAYRKLALQLHPDKNTAPRAADAFKSVSKAYDTLSDVEKRKVYDEYGEQGLQGMSSQSHDPNHQGFYGEFDAERIFREFFGFNLDVGQAFYFDDGEVLFHPRNRGRSRRVYFHHATPRRFASDSDQVNARNTLSFVLFLIPLLLLVVLPLLPNMLLEEPFKLHQTEAFAIERKIERLGRTWLYYVKSDFEQNYRTKRERAAVEKSVLLKYADYHLQRCQSQRFQKSFAIHRARNAKELSAAHNTATPDCDLYTQVVNALG